MKLVESKPKKVGVPLFRQDSVIHTVEVPSGLVEVIEVRNGPLRKLTTQPAKGSSPSDADVSAVAAKAKDLIPLTPSPNGNGRSIDDAFSGIETPPSPASPGWDDDPLNPSSTEHARAPLEVLQTEPQPDGPHVVFDNCTQSFEGDEGTVVVVKGVSFEARGNETIAVLGPSGCGKSTLLRMVSGMHPRGVTMPTVGECRIDGKPVTSPHDDVLTVFQTPALAGWHTVLGNVMLSFKPFLFGPRARFPHEVAWDWALNLILFSWEFATGTLSKILQVVTWGRLRWEAKEPTWLRRLPYSPPTAEIRDRAVALLEEVGLGDSLFKLPHQLSGGMRQRAALASVLVVNPAILCMDEPYSALDPTTRADMRKLQKRLKATHGCLTFFITHDVDEALDLADRIIVLSTRPARVLADIQLPQERSDGWAGSAEHATLEAHIHHLIRDAAKATNGHGELTLTL